MDKNEVMRMMEQVKRYNQQDEERIELKPESFECSDEPRDMVSVDGSQAFLFSMSNIWIGVVRAVGLRYSLKDGAFILSKHWVRERPVMISRNRKVMEEQDEEHRRLFALHAHDDEPEQGMINDLRKGAEEELALEISKEVRDVILSLDGSLYSKNDTMNSIADSCRERNNILVGVSKDSYTQGFGSYRTDEELLRDLEVKTGYLRAPRAEMENAKHLQGDIYFAKLHPEADKWFRVDIGTNRDRPGFVFSNIAPYASSELCPGYPYPMLDAHRFAVIVRQVHDYYEDEVMRMAVELELPLDRSIESLTRWEGGRRGAFHEYLDHVSRRI